MNYKIGQILTSTEDVKVKMALSGETVIIPKGNKVIIGADKFVYHIRDGSIQSLYDEDTVEEYDTSGLAEYLYISLRARFPIDEMLEDYDDAKLEFVEEIKYALEDIGF